MTTPETLSAVCAAKGVTAPEYIEGLKAAMASTFGAISGAEPVLLGESIESTPCEGAIGIISVVGGVAWSLSLGFPRETAIALAQKFAGFEIEFESADMGDVVGELANVLAGDVVAQLDMMGVRVSMSLPTVARGSDINIMLPGALSSLRMCYSLPEGQFWLGLAVGRPTA